MKNMRATVMDIMIKNKTTRDNDNLLVAKYLERVYGTTDMAVVAKLTKSSIGESVTRCRRLIQATNPLMASSKATSKARRRAEEKMRERMRKEV